MAELNTSPTAILREPPDRSGIALAMSGGGYRAMLFHTGALIRLNELGLLVGIKRISSVSGGSIAAAYLGFKWQRLGFNADGHAERFDEEFVQPLLEFSTHTIDRICGAVGLLTQGLLVSKIVAGYYDKYLFKGATLADLPGKEEGPLFVICASNLSTGSLFRFARPYIADWRIGRMPASDFPLSVAVAASSAFPPLLSPTRVDLRGYAVIPDSQQRAPKDEVDFQAIPKELRQRAVLTDGGVYDNHGLEPVDDWETLFVSDGGMPHDMALGGMWTWWTQTRRVLDVVDNQVRSLRRRQTIERFKRGAMANMPTPTGPWKESGRGVYWGIGTDPAGYDDSPGLTCDRSRVLELSRTPTRLKNPRDHTRRALVNWGYAICDRTLRRWHDPEIPRPEAWPMVGGL